jgi:hypothetical protein
MAIVNSLKSVVFCHCEGRINPENVADALDCQTKCGDLHILLKHEILIKTLFFSWLGCCKSGFFME